MTPFMVRVHAVPGDKIVFEEPRPLGYFQNLGVTAQDAADLTRCVREFVFGDTGGTVVEIDDVVVADTEGADRSIRERCGDVRRPGVWYASGRAFFVDDDDDEEDE